MRCDLFSGVLSAPHEAICSAPIYWLYDLSPFTQTCTAEDRVHTDLRAMGNYMFGVCHQAWIITSDPICSYFIWGHCYVQLAPAGRLLNYTITRAKSIILH